MMAGAWSRSIESAVHRRFELAKRADRALVVERKELHEQHATHLPSRIDPKLRIEKTGPTQPSGAAIVLPLLAFGSDLETEPKLIVPRTERKRLRERGISAGLLLDEYRADVIFAHQPHRARAENMHR